MSAATYADQRAHDVAWMTAAEREALNGVLLGAASDVCAALESTESDRFRIPGHEVAGYAALLDELREIRFELTR